MPKQITDPMERSTLLSVKMKYVVLAQEAGKDINDFIAQLISTIEKKHAQYEQLRATLGADAPEPVKPLAPNEELPKEEQSQVDAILAAKPQELATEGEGGGVGYAAPQEPAGSNTESEKSAKKRGRKA